MVSLALLAFCFAAPAVAGDSTEALDRARALEAEGMSELGAHFRFEEALLSEDNDRVTVFLSMPHGARVIIEELTLSIDGKPVVKHPYAVSELMLLQGRAEQLLYVSRLSRGEHQLKVDLKVMQGKVLPMRPYAFVKERTAKFIEVLLTGSPVRQIEVQEW